MAIGGAADEDTYFKGKRLSIVYKYKYLWVTISRNGIHLGEMTAHTNQVRAATKPLNFLLWNIFTIKSIIESILTYD